MASLKYLKHDLSISLPQKGQYYKVIFLKLQAIGNGIISSATGGIIMSATSGII